MGIALIYIHNTISQIGCNGVCFSFKLGYELDWMMQRVFFFLFENGICTKYRFNICMITQNAKQIKRVQFISYK